MAEIGPGFRRPEEEIAYLRDKLRIPTRTWTDLWEGMHARAFVVAGATSDALLADLHDAVVAALEQGRSLDEFRRDFDHIVAKHGWTFNGTPGWRSKVIYQTNLRMAWSAGRWAEAQRGKDTRPYLRYVAILDSRTRPLHRAWHGTILSIDDDWWKTHTPPNGWNCRCTVQTLSARDIDRWGLKVSPEAPAIDWTSVPIRTGGRTVTVSTPEGIDPGFGYNPGEAGFGRGQETIAAEVHGGWEPLDPGPAPQEAKPLPPASAGIGDLAEFGAGDRDGLKAALARAIGRVEATFVDPIQTRVVVGDGLVDALAGETTGPIRPGFELLPELLEKPSEIRIGWVRSKASARVGLRFRYVRAFRLADGRVVVALADADGGVVSGLTVLPADDRRVAELRSGVVIWGN